jgi:AraC-like DNA-binding protein
METLYAIIFVQGLIWGALLLKRSRPRVAYLGFSFLLAGVLYFLDYSERVYGFQLPVPPKFSCSLLLFLLTGYYQYKSLVLSDAGHRRIFMGGVLILLVLVFVQLHGLPANQRDTWLLAGIAGILSVITDAIFLFRRIGEKTHTGSILDISNYLLHFHILVFKILFIAIVLMDAYRFAYGPDSPVVPDLILQGVFAATVFSTGYHAVQYSFLKRPVRKKQLRKNPENLISNYVVRLLEEKKPYLDCELTLGKVADMLEMTEYELTRLLHTDMQTSFYDLINGYRIEAVKEKLLQPDSKKYTIMSAAYESGFNSSSTFYRVFKEHTGMQPGEFMQRNNQSGTPVHRTQAL